MIFKIIFSLIAVSLMGACATLQTQVDPTLGEWQYVIENLPRGEPEGMFTIEKGSFLGKYRQNTVLFEISFCDLYDCLNALIFFETFFPFFTPRYLGQDPAG